MKSHPGVRQPFKQEPELSMALKTDHADVGCWI